MNELIQFAFTSVNLAYTFLLILVLIYWLFIIIGALDFGSLDIDFDIDADVDVDVDIDVDADVDTEIEAGSGAGWFIGFLHFFNFGKLPFMVIMSFVILFSWTFSMLANYYFGEQSILFALAFAFPNLFVSLCLTKLITTPLLPVFQKLDSGIEPVDYVGLTCKLVLPASANKLGQAEVVFEDNPLLVNVKVDHESPAVFNKGEEAIIIRKEKSKPYYIIQKITDSL